MTRFMTLVLLAGLAACSGPIDRLALTPQPSSLQLSPLVGSAMVRTVSLPAYAAAEEVAVELPGGLISSNEDVLWADDPQRAVTLALTSGLSNILNADVGPEPWPFFGLPDVSIDVRVARMLAGADGAFHLSGQFYVGGDGIDFRNSADSFDISVPMTDQSLSNIATAQAAALSLLSEQIARKLGS
jgi:uncharacterized lipoprotein YmbA